MSAFEAFLWGIAAGATPATVMLAVQSWLLGRP